MKRQLRRHQQEALVVLIDEFENRSASRATVVMACGTGKTILGAEVANAISPAWAVVFLPSIALVKQTLEVWREQLPSGIRYLCVCSDQGVSTAEDELEIEIEELACEVTTDSLVIRRFLESGATSGVVFCTYHSSQLLADSIPPDVAFGLGVFDEAHRTASTGDSQFSIALENTKVPVLKRLFMTATPRRHTVERIGKDVPPKNGPVLA